MTPAEGVADFGSVVATEHAKGVATAVAEAGGVTAEEGEAAPVGWRSVGRRPPGFAAVGSAAGRPLAFDQGAGPIGNPTCNGIMHSPSGGLLGPTAGGPATAATKGRTAPRQGRSEQHPHAGAI